MTRDAAYLRHIRDAVQNILEYTHEGRDTFMRNKMMQDAAIRSLEIVGEAAKSLSPELRQKYPTIPWPNMAAMRDVWIHNYMGVDLNISLGRCAESVHGSERCYRHDPAQSRLKQFWPR